MRVIIISEEKFVRFVDEWKQPDLVKELRMFLSLERSCVETELSEKDIRQFAADE
jgi:hypothetical protein